MRELVERKKKSIGTLQSIKVLPVTPTFKVQETKRNKNNVHVAKVHGKVPILSKQIRGKSEQICPLLIMCTHQLERYLLDSDRM